jgi:hypothetical protein
VGALLFTIWGCPSGPPTGVQLDSTEPGDQGAETEEGTAPDAEIVDDPDVGDVEAPVIEALVYGSS